MRLLLRDWDARLEATPAGQRARLLDMLEGRAEFDRSGSQNLRTSRDLVT
jgi:hypothetical protein